MNQTYKLYVTLYEVYLPEYEYEVNVVNNEEILREREILCTEESLIIFNKVLGTVTVVLLAYTHS